MNQSVLVSLNKHVRDMPNRRTTDTWRSAPVPETPLQKGAFIDLCTKWIVQEPEIEKEPPLATTNLSFPISYSKKLSSSSFTQSELMFAKNTICIVCQSDQEIRNILANPFTVRSIISVCNQCIPVK